MLTARLSGLCVCSAQLCRRSKGATARSSEDCSVSGVSMGTPAPTVPSRHLLQQPRWVLRLGRQRGLCRQPRLQKTTWKPSPEENSQPANDAAACQRPVCPVLWRRGFRKVFSGYRLSSCLVRCSVSQLVYMPFVCLVALAVAGLLSSLDARVWFRFVVTFYCLIGFCCCRCCLRALLH